MDLSYITKKKPEAIIPLVENFKKNFRAQFGVECTPAQVKKWTAKYLAAEQEKFFMGWSESWHAVDMDGLETYFEAPKPKPLPKPQGSRGTI